jgi:hypothetical protein
MKKIVALAAGFSVLASVGAGNAIADDTSESVRDVSEFNQVKTKGSIDISVVVGDSQSVKVIADSDIIDDIRTDVSGGELIVRFKNHNSWRNIDVARVEVTVPSLEAAQIDGSGDIWVDGATGDEFEADINGSGDMVLVNSNVKNVEIDIKGSGDVEAEGTCEELEVEIKGSGDVSAQKLECKVGDVGIMGSGDVEAFLKDSVKVSIMGSGDVAVYGKPGSVRSSSMGSGDVVIR